MKIALDPYMIRHLSLAQGFVLHLQLDLMHPQFVQ